MLFVVVGCLWLVVAIDCSCVLSLFIAVIVCFCLSWLFVVGNCLLFVACRCRLLLLLVFPVAC